MYVYSVVFLLSVWGGGGVFLFIFWLCLLFCFPIIETSLFLAFFGVMLVKGLFIFSDL